MRSNSLSPYLSVLYICNVTPSWKQGGFFYILRLRNIVLEHV